MANQPVEATIDTQMLVVGAPDSHSGPSQNAPQSHVSRNTDSAESAEQEVLQPGAMVAHRYEIQSLLGAGGMGAVYRAIDRELEEPVALKALRKSISNESNAIERFRREVKLARMVTHPNVARTFDLGKCEGFRFLTMELIEGTSLGTRLDHSGSMTLGDALRITADVARGLVAAHSAGVVHRDLKPDNVLLGGGNKTGSLQGTERVVITDFGIARLTNGRGEPIESATANPKALTVGGIIGTPAYMAPEQVVGETPDGRSDIFALTILLYELLTARLPFHGDTAMSLALARLHEAPKDIRMFLPDIPEAVAELIARGLQRNREERPDADQFLSAIERLRGAAKMSTHDPVESLAKMPGTSTLAIGNAKPLPFKSLSVCNLTSADPALKPLANELSLTLADALTKSKLLKVVPPSHEDSDDALKMARDHKTEVAVGGTIRAEADKLRVNLRMIDAAQGVLRWSERFEGTISGQFALEDVLARTVDNALRAMLVGEEHRNVGPSDPTARALYEKAIEKVHLMNDVEAQKEAADLARRALKLVPNDASVMSILGFALVRCALAQREDPTLIAEAEEWALRALNTDANSAQTYATLGLVRLHQGDLRASIRAFREAIARDPKHGEANAYLGRFLVETGFLEEGIQRLEFARKIEPQIQHTYWNLSRAYALQNDWTRADQVLSDAAALTNNALSTHIVSARLSVWRKDPINAAIVADRIEAAGLPEGHFVRSFIPALRGLRDNDQAANEAETMRQSADRVPSPSMKAFWYQVAAEVFATQGLIDRALDAIESAASHAFIDLGWMDFCPALEGTRSSGRFGRARAIVSARAANLWR